MPWLFDDDEDAEGSAVRVTRRFAKLKNRLAPYLIEAGREAAATGLPVMRPMVLAFPDDPTAAYLDRQYLLGPDLLVAPVFTESGDVELYLPAGTWTSAAHRRAGDGRRLAPRAARVRLAAAVRAGGRGAAAAARARTGPTRTTSTA